MTNSMRAQGEQDRSEEFRQGRDAFVGSVNDWLQDLAGWRDEGRELKSGMPIESSPRITQVILGRTAMGSHNILEHEPGVSLTGDGTTTRLKLQAVLPGTDNESYDVVQVSGRDPLESQFHGDGVTPRASQNVVASVRMGTIGSQPETRFGYTVYGDGRVEREYIEPDGTLRYVSTVDAVDMVAAVDSLRIVQHAMDDEPR